jgi:protease-4
MWLALKELRDKKPVIVSVGDMAASGGYYISSAGTKIYAEPESIVGSIGVVGGKLSFGGTLAMVGVHTATFGDKRAASLASVTEPWDEATRARLLAGMNTIYDLFLDRLSEGRGKPREAFLGSAEGRVFGGLQAKELGLVDEIGGLSDALAAAKVAGGLPKDAPIVTDTQEGFLGIDGLGDDVKTPVKEIVGEDPALTAFFGQVPEGIAPELASLRRWIGAFVRATKENGVAAMLPVPIVLR